MTGCTQISNGLYRTDSETARTIPVCDKNGAVFWKADMDMDIDCDGQRTAQCNENTDCCFLPDTAFHQSDGRPLNAAALPFVVVPSPSGTWDYRQWGIRGGGVVAIIFNNQIEYAVVGGTDSGVTYIFFKYSQASPIENHSVAVSQGEQLARTFINNN